MAGAGVAAGVGATVADAAFATAGAAAGEFVVPRSKARMPTAVEAAIAAIIMVFFIILSWMTGISPEPRPDNCFSNYVRAPG